MAQEESTVSTACNAIAEADTIALAKEAVRAGLIKQDVLDHLTSLNPQVSNSMKHRYLLLHLREAVKDDEHLFARMVEILVEFQNIATNTDTDSTSVSFGSEHIHELVEFLAKYAYKWDLIGTALKFQPQDLSNIKANNVYRCDFVMNNLMSLLEEWTEKKHKHTLPPTKGNLQRALNSLTVGLGALACELNKMFTLVPSETSTSLVVSLDLNMTSGGSTFTPTYSQNMKMHAEENGSVLLEIQTTTYQPNLTYQWLVKGIEIPESTVHTGTTAPVLCISNADIEMDGLKYECTITHGACAPFKTKHITLRVDCPLDVYTNSLVRMYTARPEVPRDTWPPVSSKKHINLALIRQEQVNYSAQYAHLTIRGDMDDILQHKEMIDYDQVFISLRCGRLILIEGRPGSGKTTFVHKITRDWATTTNNGGMRLVLLVSLRVLNSIHNPNLNDILKLFLDLKVSKDQIEERNGKGVCFIFDGLDEYSSSAINGSQESVVHRIIDKEYLNQSIVIVASRPAAIVKLRSKADKVIEVVGFRREQIFEYFDHYPFSDQSKSTKLKAYLSVHPNILHMCYLPVHAAIVGHLFEVTGRVPQTETEIYTHFTRFTLMRNNKESEISSIDVHKSRIYKFALERTLLNEQVLHQDEVTALLKSDTALGLATVDHTAALYGYKKIYTFLHLTFQEYLAAYYISTLSDEEQDKLIQEHGHKNHMLAVWKFYCGLVKFDVKNSRFKALLGNTSGKNLFHIQCAYESQQSLICTQLLKSKKYHMQLTGTYLTTPDFTAMGYIINTTVLPVTLSLTNCKINFEAIDAMMLQMQGKACLLKNLYITSCDTDMECVKKLLVNMKSMKRLAVSLTQSSSSIGQVQLLADGLKECTKLEELDISGNCLRHGSPLATGLTSCSNLEIIRIRDNNISADGISAIFKEIRNCKLKVKQQDITEGNDINITNTDFIDILQDCTNLQSLEITLYTREISNLCSSSKNWQSLTELKVYRHLLSEQVDVNFPFYNFRLQKLLLSNFVIDEGNLANSFSHYPNLQILDLSNSKLIGKGVETICKSLKHCTRLTGLHLNNCTIGPHGAKALSLGLLHFYKNLQTLELCNNSIGEDGAKALAANLQRCTQLKILDLTFNKIGENGAKALVANIHHCLELEKLALNLNEISEDGAKALATSLRCCTKLKELNL